MFGPAHLLDKLSATREKAKLSINMIRFMIIKSLAIRIFGRVCGGIQMVMEIRWRNLTNL